MRKVFVCAGKTLAKNEKINNQCKLLGQILAEKNMCYVQGSSVKGLSGLILKNFTKKSDNFMFIIPEDYMESYLPYLKAFTGKKFLRIKKTTGVMEQLDSIISCDHIVVMPGGSRTLEELLYANEAARLGEHESHITLVNVDGFYDNFIAQVKRSMEEGFIKPTSIHFEVVNDVREIDFCSENESER